MSSTVPQRHHLNPCLPLLKRDCTLVVVGTLEVMAPVNDQQVAFHRRNISGSLIVNIAETRKVVDFCARQGIGPDIGMLRIQDLNEAYARIEQGEVRFRYVIAMASLREESVATTSASGPGECRATGGDRLFGGRRWPAGGLPLQA